MSIEDILRRQIETDGPLTVAQVMELALWHPDHGYYAQSAVLGRSGDFVTAPEVSQMFGEMAGAWLLNAWQQAGKPAPITLLELGPGRGTLMTDILRVARLVPAFTETASIRLVERSDALQVAQREALTDSPLPVTWHTSVEEALAAASPVLFIANEFFDALPIRQFVYTEEMWRERRLGLSDGGDLQFGLDREPAFVAELRGAGEPRDGFLKEVSPQARRIMEVLCTHIAEEGGAGLIIDYGYGEADGADTLQAVRAHEKTEVLDALGTADLSAHVDFGALTESALDAGLDPAPLQTQGEFLRACGIDQRAAFLKEQSPDHAPDIEAALARLTGNEEMGELFKVLAVTAPSDPELEDL